MTIPYVYWLKNKTTGLKYIGIKYAKGANPKSFWKTYFTSSKHVKKLVSIFGKEDFIFRILKIFENEYDALVFENHLNRLAFNRDDYLNLHYNFLREGSSEKDYLAVREKQRKVARLYGDLSVVLKRGIHGLSAEQKQIICSKGGVSAAEINRELGRAIFDPLVRERQHHILRTQKLSAFYDPVLKKQISVLGGKAGIFTKSYYEKHGLSEDSRIEAQRERGRRGGPKNKGFRWFNDGLKSYKYTAKQQKELEFDMFIEQNNFKMGKIPNNTNKIWINDGVRNQMIMSEEYNEKIHTKGRLGDKGKYNGHKNKENHQD